MTELINKKKHFETAVFLFKHLLAQKNLPSEVKEELKQEIDSCEEKIRNLEVDSATKEENPNMAEGDKFHNIERLIPGYKIEGEKAFQVTIHLKKHNIRVKECLISEKERNVLERHKPNFDLWIDTCQNQIIENKHKLGEIKGLTAKPRSILFLLMKKAPDKLTYLQIKDKIWGEDREIEKNAIERTVTSLRNAIQKVKEKRYKTYIKTVNNLIYPEHRISYGYYFDDSVNYCLIEYV